MYFLATGTDLVTLFIGLELMALCFYVMVGFLRGDKRSNEAAMKYLLLGAFSSGFLAYGFSMLYGISGSTKLRDIAAAIAQRQPLGSDGLPGAGHHRGRTAVQDLGRAVPHVGAGCLRGRADHGDGVSLGGLQSRLHSRSCCACSTGPLRFGSREVWEPMLVRGRGAHPDRRQPGRHHPDQHQAAAGLQLDLARRLHAARPDRRQRAPASRASRSTSWSTRS